MASTIIVQTTVTFEKYNETTIRKLITQCNMVQITITRYYYPVNLRTEVRNETKIPSSDENEGIKLMSPLILSSFYLAVVDKPNSQPVIELSNESDDCELVKRRRGSVTPSHSTLNMLSMKTTLSQETS